AVVGRVGYAGTAANDAALQALVVGAVEADGTIGGAAANVEAWLAACRKREQQCKRDSHEGRLPRHRRNGGNRTPCVSAGSKRSPCSRNRSGMVRKLNCDGSRPGFTSFQRSGADTGAPDTPRGEYGATTVFP